MREDERIAFLPNCSIQEHTVIHRRYMELGGDSSGATGTH
jgi:hypothetical protein